MFAQYFVLLVFSALTLALPYDDFSLHQFRGHVLKNNGNYEIVTALADSYEEPDNYADHVLATGFWSENYNITGWSVLEIRTFENQTNIEQVYSAGLLEGRLTRGLIGFSPCINQSLPFFCIEITGMQWQNTVEEICANQTDFCAKLKNFFLTQLDWIYSQIDKHPEDEYWHQVCAQKTEP